MKLIHGILFSSAVGALVACSLDSVQAPGTLSVRIDGLPSGRVQALQPALLSASGTPPSTAAEFDCFAVNVTGPGIPDTSKNPEPNREFLFDRLLRRESYCSYRGLLAGPVMGASTEAKEISLMVPPGAPRLVQVVGVKERSGSNTCVSEFDPNVAEVGDADVYELGRAVVDLFRDQSVSIAMEWDALTAVERGKRLLNCGSSISPTPTSSSYPVPTPALLAGSSGASAVAQTSHTCILLSGSVKCKGNNDNGQIGMGTVGSLIPTFTSVVDNANTAISGVSQIAISQFGSCARIGTSGVKCWGSAYLSGTAAVTPYATSISLSGSVTDLAVGSGHACVVVDGGVKCWGYNGFGQLGNGSQGDATTPVQAIAAGSGVTSVVAGDSHTCALFSGGTAKCWGSNASGQLGSAVASPQTVPTPVSSLSNATQLAAGGSFNCALTSVPDVRCWGQNAYGQLGTGNTTGSSTPVIVSGLSSPTLMKTGSYMVCVKDSIGVKCWGRNNLGQLGDGTLSDRSSPPTGGISGLTSVSGLSVSPSAANACAITAGGVYCWGSNTYQQIFPF